MKKLLLIPACIGLFAFAGLPSHKMASLKKNSNPMAYAKNYAGIIMDTATIDEAGNYRFLHLLPGTYTVEIKKPGSELLVIKNVEHLGANYSYHIAGETKGRAEANGMFVDGIRTIGSGEIPSGTGDEEMSASRGISVRGSRSDGAGTYVDGYRVESESAKKAKSPTATAGAMIAMGKADGSPSGHAVEGMKVGQMTAGNWRDLDNWDKWKETNKDANIKALQGTWGFFPENRFSTQFLDSKGKPVIGAKVVLTDNFKAKQWETYTDNKGIAELWSLMNSEVTTAVVRDYKINVTIGENSYDFGVKPFSGSADVFSLPIVAVADAIADIAFVVDATGSMGDEINYLQAELLDVATRVKKSNACLNLRLGSVFYRDHGDAFVTKKSDFSSNVTNVANFIYEQSAGGGGDFPEAVDDAMEAAIDGLSWSKNAIAKIMFLVLDAPPHETPEIKERMQKYTKLAAEKGIKIVPVMASGINQSTEFLMKYMAIATNGNYVYITDHSGIGNIHEKPTGVKENVQYLNDLMVDIINKNTKWDGCKDSTQNPNPNQNPGTVEIVTNGQWQVQFYPNPATDKIMVKSNEKLDEITMISMNGETVKKVDQIDPEKTTIDITNIPTGVYIVRCRKGENQVSCRILVMK